MRKFVKISSLIISMSILFFMGNKLFFKDRISIEDYKAQNTMYTELELDSYKNTKQGIFIKMKIKNMSNYIYCLDSASLRFITNKSNEAFDINMIPVNWEDEKNIMWYGVEPKKEGYIEFLLPTDIKINYEYFDLESTKLVYEGGFKRNLPFGKAYMIVGKEYKEDSIKDIDKKIEKILKGE